MRILPYVLAFLVISLLWLGIGPAFSDGETAAPAGSDWVEDEHTQSAGESSRRAETKHLSDEQLAAVHEALSEEGIRAGSKWCTCMMPRTRS